jgi:PIN domain nuclease of toxin-antitoxin system
VGRSVLIVLDTHVVIWLAQDYQRISPAAQSAIREARVNNHGLAISSITLVEIARLGSYRQVNLTPDLETFLFDVEQRFLVLPITSYIVLQAFELPSTYPNDPVDRIIGATALIEDIPLITADREIRKSRTVSTIW